MSENLSSFVNKSYQGEHPGQEGENDSDENTPTQVGSIQTKEKDEGFLIAFRSLFWDLSLCKY